MTGLRAGLRLRCVLLALAICSLNAPPLSASPQSTPTKPTATQQGSAVEAAVRTTLQKYEAALESLDPDAVRKVHPTIRVDSLAKAFRDMQELKVDIDEVRVLSVDGPIARVSCRVTQSLTPKVGSRQTSAVNRVLRLKREGDDWTIEGFER